MRLLVTRPEPGASVTAARLAAAGHAPLVSPVLTAERVAATIPAQPWQAMLVTSAAAARFAPANLERTISVLAVGDATAEAARAAGFSRVASAGGDATALADLAKARAMPQAGPLLYLSAEETATDLAAALPGFAVVRIIVYRMRPEPLTGAAIQALEDGALDAVSFYSRATAAAFVTAAQGLAVDWIRLEAHAISTQAAEPLSALPWRRLRLAARPDEEAMSALVG